MTSEQSVISTPKDIALAWLVHAFTMTGAVWALLAMLAVMDGKPKMAFLWFLIALIVDGIDGTFARMAQVKVHVPWFDGSILDIVVDYLTYTFVPALFLYKFLPMPNMFLQILAISMICVGSTFCYCNVKMKSKDNYFVGFPAVWNMVILYFYLLQTPAWFNFATIVILSVLTLSNIKFVHPFRVKRLMPINIVAITAWLITSTMLVVSFPAHNPIVAGIWWASIAWTLGIGFWRTWRARTENEQN